MSWEGVRATAAAVPLGSVGVAPASAPFERLHQRIALVVVVVPALGVISAVAWWWGRGVGPTELILLAVMYALTGLGISTGFHRLFAHRAFDTVQPIRMVLAILGSMDAQGPVLFWAAIHRRHHKFADQAGDPHSPHLHGEGFGGLARGLWHAHMGWLFVAEVTDWGRYIPELIADRALFRINRLYFVWVFLGLAIPTAIDATLTASWTGAFQGLLWGGLVRIFLGHHATWSINSICHVYGSHPYKARDASANNLWLALLSFGESWHNNHHAFPSSAFHGLEWWQVDISGALIRGLGVARLAWGIKSPTAHQLAAKRIAS